MMSNEKVKQLVELSMHNAPRIQIHPQMCGCYSCKTLFNSSEIDDEHLYPEQDGASTVICPHCGVDTILGEQDFSKVGEALSQTTIDEVSRIAYDLKEQ